MAKKLGPQTLVTKAAPVTPTLAVPRFEGLDRLAQALTTFGERLPQIVIAREAKKAEEQLAKGRAAAAAAIAQGKDTFMELREAGILSKGSDPFFRDGVLEAAGKARADQFGASLQVAYAERFADNPSFSEEDFDDFADKFAADFDEENPGLDDPAVTDGFALRAGDYLNSQRQKHAGIVADNLIELGDETLGISFRGRILDRKVNGDPLTQVADTILGLEEVRLDFITNQGGIERMSSFEKTRMNNKLVDTILSAVVTGDLTDAQATEILDKMQSGKGSSLLGIPRHAEALTKAASTRAAFVLQQDSLAETVRVRAQQKLEGEGRAMVFAAFEEGNGDIDIGPLLELVRVNGDAYGDNYVAEINGLRDDLLGAAAAPYISNRVLKDSILTNIVQRNFTDPEALRALIGQSIGRNGGINPSDALLLQKELDKIVEMDAAGGNRLRLFDNVMNEVKGAVGAFSPDAILRANGDAAAVPTTLLFNEFFAKNPDVQQSDVIYQEFVTSTIKTMRDQFLPPETREVIDDLVRQTLVSNQTAHFETTTYITDVPTLTRWLAEAELELGDEGSGTFISEDLNLFLQVSGRAIPEESQGEADIIEAAVLGQLRRNAVKFDDKSFRRQVDGIKQVLLQENQALRNRASGRIPVSSGLGVQGLLDTIAQSEARKRKSAQAARNRLAQLPAPEQNPNIPITPTGTGGS